MEAVVRCMVELGRLVCLGALAIAASSIFLGGCRTPPAIPEMDLGKSGWQCWEGQAVWQSKRVQSPAMTGDLRVCVHPSDRAFLQFDKPGLNMVTYREGDGVWSLKIPALNRRAGGRMPPPRSLAWAELIRFLRDEPLGRDWEVRKRGAETWLLTNRQNQAWVKGYLKRSDVGGSP